MLLSNPILIRVSFLLILLTTLGNQLPAQVSSGGRPYSFDNPSQVPTTLSTVQMPPIDLATLQREDMADEAMGRPPRFGYRHPVHLSAQNFGEWHTLPNGDLLWRAAITCPDAKSINLLYANFQLPVGGVLHLYSADRRQLIGGFTAANNKPDRVFATGLLYSDTIVLEYWQPAVVRQQPTIEINYVVQGYRYIELGEQKAFGDAGSCNVNTICSQGDGWRNQIKGVALMLVGGNRWCTGSLVNNTAQDCRPLFLTANHCLDTYDAVDAPNANTFSFIWNYESPTCSPSTDGPTTFTTSGATVLANPGSPGDIISSDFALLELAESPALAGYDVFFVGFDATTSAPAATTGIHHPRGDVKKISMENDAVSGTSYSGSGGTATHWRVADWDSGTTEPGSSGSPLFSNATGRTIGFLSGGAAACGNNDSDWYGQLGYSWDNGGATDSRRRLRDHLDPLGSGATTFVNGIGSPCICDLVINNVLVTPEVCPNGADGTIVVSTAGGNGPFTFDLFGPTSQSNSTGIFTNLLPGSYQVTVSDNGLSGCEAMATAVVLAGIDLTPPAITCPTDRMVSCDSINDLTATGMASAVDNCDPSPVISFSDVILSGDCNWECTVERTWRSEDMYGNVSTCVQTIVSSALPLLEAALSTDVDRDGQPDPLVLGYSRHTLSLDVSAAGCIIGWMPAMGTEATALSRGQAVVGADCLPGFNPLGVDGRLQNPLLAAGLSLGIKLRLNPDFGETLLSTTGCAFHPVLAQYLPNQPSIDDLYQLINLALGNLIGPPHLPHLLNALICLNDLQPICEVVSSGSRVESGRPTFQQFPVIEQASGVARVYPNPTSGQIYLELADDTSDELFLEWYRADGQAMPEVKWHTTQANLVTIDLAGHPAGVYFLRLRAEAGTTQMWRVIKL